MKRLLLSVFLTCSLSCAAQVADPLLAHVTVLTSPESHEAALDRTRVAAALGHIADYLRLSPEQLPSIVVIYANPQTHVDGLPEHAKITVARINIADSSLYQVWITGQASDGNTIKGLVWAVNRHLDLHLGEARVGEVCERVLQQMSEVVSAGELAHKRH